MRLNAGNVSIAPVMLLTVAVSVDAYQGIQRQAVVKTVKFFKLQI